MKLRLSAVPIALIEVVGTFGATANQPGRYDVTALSLVLVLVGPAALLVRDRYPRSVAAVALTSVVVYVALGYAYGPVFLSAVLALAWMVIARYRRDAWILAGLGLVGLAGADFIDPNSTEPGWLHFGLVAGWLAVVLFGSELVRMRRDELASRVQAEREERQRIVGEQRMALAQDLHDVLAHNISLVNVQASVALHLIDEQPERAKPALAAIKDASHVALRELRSALDLLRDGSAPRAPAPQLADLPRLIEGVRASGLRVYFTQADTPELPSPVQLAAYRIVQEALTNVTRHAHANAVHVDIGFDGDLTVSVEDDGVGGQPVAGNGLIGMRERAVALGGSFAAGPGAVGFRIAVRLPVAAA